MQTVSKETVERTQLWAGALKALASLRAAQGARVRRVIEMAMKYAHSGTVVAFLRKALAKVRSGNDGGAARYAGLWLVEQLSRERPSLDLDYLEPLAAALNLSDGRLLSSASDITVDLPDEDLTPAPPPSPPKTRGGRGGRGSRGGRGGRGSRGGRGGVASTLPRNLS